MLAKLARPKPSPLPAAATPWGEVQGRGILNCGVSGSLLAFSFPDDNGVMQGFDADYCRAVVPRLRWATPKRLSSAAGNASERFPILQSGEIDVLIRNTTWTTQRDTALGFNFTPVTFYDGQGMIVA